MINASEIDELKNFIFTPPSEITDWDLDSDIEDDEDEDDE